MQQMRTKIGTVNLKREGKFGRENFKSTFKGLLLVVYGEKRRFGMFGFLSKYIVKPSVKTEKDMEDLQVNYKFRSIYN